VRISSCLHGFSNVIISYRYSQPPTSQMGLLSLPQFEQQAFSWRLNIGRICENCGPGSHMVGAVEDFETPPSSLSKLRQRVSSVIGFHLHPKAHHASSLTGNDTRLEWQASKQGMVYCSQRRNQRELHERCFLCAVPLARFQLGGIIGADTIRSPSPHGTRLRSAAEVSSSYILQRRLHACTCVTTRHRWTPQ
jgi:hypothetical protein